ncbi:hypothetical protein GJAV_G00210680 [Gymnothorax javanicus]|nr:hypothetical protein GJAV_G00210680 [Gymnothorax javanicus]
MPDATQRDCPRNAEMDIRTLKRAIQARTSQPAIRGVLETLLDYLTQFKTEPVSRGETSKHNFGQNGTRHITAYHLLQARFMRETPSSPKTRRREVGGLLPQEGWGHRIKKRAGGQGGVEDKSGTSLGGSRRTQISGGSSVQKMIAKFSAVTQKEKKDPTQAHNEPRNAKHLGRCPLFSAMIGKFEGRGKGAAFFKANNRCKVNPQCETLASFFTMENKANGTRSMQHYSGSKNSAKDRIQRVDPYGFERSEDFDYESYEELMSEYLVVLTRRAIKWSKLLKGGSRVQRSLKVKRYVRKGIPNEHRALIWMLSSGAQERLENNPGYYHKLLESEHDDRLVDTIRTDLHRTFPDNVHFRKTSNPCLQRTLFNVLVAYGHHNKNVGYCQGMNFISGYLLIITKDEEKAFWLLDALLSRILPDYYTPAMLGLKTDQEVLGELVRLKVPAVWQVMAEHGVMWTLVVSRWFICLFIDILPVETVLRIWDCLFYEGSKIIFRAALTLIKHNQALILQARNFPDVCDQFKDVTKGPFVEDCHTFMQKIFTEPGSLPMATIDKLREKCRRQIQAQES